MYSSTEFPDLVLGKLAVHKCLAIELKIKLRIFMSEYDDEQGGSAAHVSEIVGSSVRDVLLV